MPMILKSIAFVTNQCHTNAGRQNRCGKRATYAIAINAPIWQKHSILQFGSGISEKPRPWRQFGDRMNRERNWPQISEGFTTRTRFVSSQFAEEFDDKRKIMATELMPNYAQVGNPSHELLHNGTLAQRPVEFQGEMMVTGTQCQSSISELAAIVERQQICRPQQ